MMDIRDFPVLFRRYTRNFLTKQHRLIQSLASFVSIFTFLGIVPFYPIEVLIIASAGLAVVAYVRERSSIIIGFLLGIPSYFHNSTNAVFGILGIFVSFWMIYATRKDWKLGAFSMLIASFCSLPSIYPFASVLIITTGIFFGTRFGGILGATSVLSSMFFLLGYGEYNTGLIFLPKVESLISPATHNIEIHNFIPRKVIDSFSEIYANKNLEELVIEPFNSISWVFMNSFVIYVNVILWGAGGWISGRIINRFKKNIGWLSFPTAAIAGSFLIILSALYAIRSLQLPMDNFPIDSTVILLCSTVLLSISLFPLFNYFDRFIASERKKISQIISIARPIETNDMSMSDIGGYNEVKQEVRESIVWPLERQDLISKYRIIPPRGFLLFGPPGCGKQKMILAAANETCASVFFIKCKEIVSMWEDEDDMDKIFKIGLDFAPCLLLFMDIDAIARRMSSQTVAPRSLEMIFDSYLRGLDTISKNPYVIPVGIMSSTIEIDDQVLAPGRLEKLIYMPLPVQDDREEIFKVHLSGRPISKDMDFKELARMTRWYTDASIEAVCNQASLFAARRSSQKSQGQLIIMDDLKKAIKEIPTSCTQSLERSFVRSCKIMEDRVVRVRIRQKLREILEEK